MARIGYARSNDNSLGTQVADLQAAGCETVFSDLVVSGLRLNDWPGLANALAQLKAGDTLVVTDMGRLGRSADKVTEIGKQLRKRGVELVTAERAAATDAATAGTATADELRDLLMHAVLDYGIAKAQAAAAKDVEQHRARTHVANEAFVKVSQLAAQLHALAKA